MLSEEQIVFRIKKLRLERNLTQKELADAVGVTKGYLSKIENASTAPPVSTLINLARALGVSLDAFFAEENPESIYTVVRKAERQTVARKKSPRGYSYQPLAQNFPKRAMEPHILLIAASDEPTAAFQHKGQEFLLVLDGSLELVIAEHRIVLDQGDSIYFDSGYPHTARGLGDSECRCLMAIYIGEKTETDEPAQATAEQAPD